MLKIDTGMLLLTPEKDRYTLSVQLRHEAESLHGAPKQIIKGILHLAAGLYQEKMMKMGFTDVCMIPELTVLRMHADKKGCEVSVVGMGSKPVDGILH